MEEDNQAVSTSQVSTGTFPEKFVDMSPRDFELSVKDWIKSSWTKMLKFKVEHNVNLVAHDGEYQIDVFATLDIHPAQVKFLVECKKLGRSVERDEVMVLNQRLQSLGCHKGIIFATSGFQSGAVKFAKKNGICLCVPSNDEWEPIVKAHTPDEEPLQPFHPMLFLHQNQFRYLSDPDLFETVLGVEHGSKHLNRLLQSAI